VRFRFAILFVLLVSSVLCAPAGAAVRLHAPTGELRSGELFEVRWQGLPSEAREVELELSLDGGRWIRISPELNALDGWWRWRVPQIAAESARLRLRCGGEHREEIAMVSEPFGIVTGPAAKGRRDFLGEWWPELDDSASRGVRPHSLDTNGPAFSRNESRASAHVPSTPTLDAPADEGEPLHEQEVLRSSAVRACARSARPAFVPMRN
jgi:hypothetical protein